MGHSRHFSKCMGSAFSAFNREAPYVREIPTTIVCSFLQPIDLYRCIFRCFLSLILDQRYKWTSFIFYTQSHDCGFDVRSLLFSHQDRRATEPASKLAPIRVVRLFKSRLLDPVSASTRGCSITCVKKARKGLGVRCSS